MLSESGRTQTVRKTVVKPKPLKAYNLTVADWHTYFVKGSQAETEGFGFIMIVRMEIYRIINLLAKEKNLHQLKRKQSSKKT
ncbi:HINT domain-containing protein [Neisseria gonorrhoeae]|uniref:HINT domain-containing protein n=1 Tax=Neisseria gonorrhoeae TaxID=485 RepID=UPI0021D0C12B|nr:HINT domain-containing protein [Neisseria gonorrhoeae]MCU4680921.1 HINT domain-containing protein [Neisseria gonorrhoeae]